MCKSAQAQWPQGATTRSGIVAAGPAAGTTSTDIPHEGGCITNAPGNASKWTRWVANSDMVAKLNQIVTSALVYLSDENPSLVCATPHKRAVCVTTASAANDTFFTISPAIVLTSFANERFPSGFDSSHSRQPLATTPRLNCTSFKLSPFC